VPARTQAHREISAEIGGIVKNNGPTDPRLPALRARLTEVRAEQQVRAGVKALVPNSPPVADAVIAILRAARTAASAGDRDG